MHRSTRPPVDRSIKNIYRGDLVPTGEITARSPCRVRANSVQRTVCWIERHGPLRRSVRGQDYTCNARSLGTEQG